MSPDEFRTVKVRLHFPTGAKPPRHARLRIRVEDVSGADRESTVIAEGTPEPLGGGDSAIQVSVPAGLIDPRSSYSVFIHVDADGSGRITAGDFISPAVHPVLTRGAPDAIEAKLIRVGGS